MWKPNVATKTALPPPSRGGGTLYLQGHGESRLFRQAIQNNPARSQGREEKGQEKALTCGPSCLVRSTGKALRARVEEI